MECGKQTGFCGICRAFIPNTDGVRNETIDGLVCDECYIIFHKLLEDVRERNIVTFDYDLLREYACGLNIRFDDLIYHIKRYYRALSNEHKIKIITNITAELRNAEIVDTVTRLGDNRICKGARVRHE